MNYKKNICTWLCADTIGEESNYSQMINRGKSSSQQFLDVYWKNICVFFITCKKFNSNVNFILFTNVEIPQRINNLDLKDFFENLEVQVILVEFDYRTPKNYYSGWRNQFFEFSIFEKIISLNEKKDDDLFLLLDSDCVFTSSLDKLWEVASVNGYMVYKMNYEEDKMINGISRLQMRDVYSELLNEPVLNVPEYYGGEFFLCSLKIIRLVVRDFKKIWPMLLKRNELNMPKLNEEAHTLSFIYFKNGLENSFANNFISRLWTDPFIFRNVTKEDEEKVIWHLPHEKKHGILSLFNILAKDYSASLRMPNAKLKKLLSFHLTIPNIPLTVYITRVMPIFVARKIYYTFKK